MHAVNARNSIIPTIAGKLNLDMEVDMTSSRRNFTFLILLLTVISTVGWGSIYFFRARAAASGMAAQSPARSEATPVVQPSAAETVGVIIETKQVAHDGIVATLSSLTVDESRTSAEICLDLPDTGDWVPEFSLTQEATVVQADSWQLLNGKNAETFAGTHRCSRVTFPVGLHRLDDEMPMRLTIDRLATSFPEVIDADICEQARERFMAQNPGLDLTCVQENAMLVPQAIGDLTRMSEPELNQRVADAFRRIAEGPWEFVVLVE